MRQGDLINQPASLGVTNVCAWQTMMVSYLCAWLGVKLLVLNVHGGTVESDILGITDTFAVRISGVTQVSLHLLKQCCMLARRQR